MSGSWLGKRMARDERLDFIRSFQEHHDGAGSPAHSALFIRRDSLESHPMLLLPPGHERIAEALSPGGWEICARPATGSWVVVVGHADALLRFGLRV